MRPLLLVVALAALSLLLAPARRPPRKRRTKSAPPSAATARCTTPIATGPDTPGEVNVARFVAVPGAHLQREARLPLRARGRGREGRGRRGRAAKSRWSNCTSTTPCSPAATIRAGLVLPPDRDPQRDPRAAHLQRRRAARLRSRRHPHARGGTSASALVGTLPGSIGSELSGVSAQRSRRQRLLRATEGIRGGRQEGKEASFANPSLTGRLEWARPGLRHRRLVLVRGHRADQDPALGTGTFDNAVALVSADARYDVGAFMFRGVVANISIADAGADQRRVRRAGREPDRGRLRRGRVQRAARRWRRRPPQQLNAFLRHERFNTQAGVPDGVTRDEALARRITTVGPVLQAGLQRGLQGRLPASAQQGGRGRGRAGESGGGVSVLDGTAGSGQAVW